MKHDFSDAQTASDPSWTQPLDEVAAMVADDPRHRFFDVEDFMVMDRLVRSPRPSITVYKHVFTRRCLHLDKNLQAYRFVANRQPSRTIGRHLRQPLEDAIRALRLDELPWLKPGLELAQRGLTWDQRFSLGGGDRRRRPASTTPTEDGHHGHLHVV